MKQIARKVTRPPLLPSGSFHGHESYVVNVSRDGSDAAFALDRAGIVSGIQILEANLDAAQSDARDLIRK